MRSAAKFASREEGEPEDAGGAVGVQVAARAQIWCGWQLDTS